MYIHRDRHTHTYAEMHIAGASSDSGQQNHKLVTTWEFGAFEKLEISVFQEHRRSVFSLFFIVCSFQLFMCVYVSMYFCEYRRSVIRSCQLFMHVCMYARMHVCECRRSSIISCQLFMHVCVYVCVLVMYVWIILLRLRRMYAHDQALSSYGSARVSFSVV